MADPGQIGTDVWVLRGGLPRHGINVFFVREGNAVACFDSGSREMAGQLRRLAAPHGGISRVVLSHAHSDHRGAARGLRASVWCHPEERLAVEGDAGRSYWAHNHGPKLSVLRGLVMGSLRDGGPVSVSGTVDEGDRVGAFEVLHLPGHAPGQIALWHADAALILVSDCFYTLDARTAALPKAAFNHDEDGTRASVRRIAELEPRLAWPAHGPGLTGDVRGALERALEGAQH